MATIPDLTALVEQAWRLEKQFAGTATEADKLAVGTLDNWSIKDNLAHDAMWIQRLAENLALARNGSVGETIQDFNAHNNEAFFKYQNEIWKDVIERSDAAFQTVLSELSVLDPKLLDRTDILPGRNPRPVWRTIAGTVCLHPIAHQSSYYSQHGRPADAGRIYAETIPILAVLSDDPEWQSLLKYDQACGYALAGEKARAIATLEQALDMAPEFIEWSKQDSDLASLHDDPAFWALYPQVEG